MTTVTILILVLFGGGATVERARTEWNPFSVHRSTDGDRDIQYTDCSWPNDCQDVGDNPGTGTN